jgi:putative ABC transport system permease protein
MNTIHHVKEAPPSTGIPPTTSSAHKQGTLPPLRAQDFNKVGNLGSNVALALEALWANRLRSLLTTIGIIIGVASVVAAVSLIQGFSVNITNTITSLGSNMIIIAPGAGNNISNVGTTASSRVSSALPSSETTLSLTPADAQAINKIPDVAAVSPILSIHDQVIYGNQNRDTHIEGVNASLQQIQNWTVTQGDWFSNSDEQGAHSVAVQSIYSSLPPQARTRLARPSVFEINSSAS